MRVERAYRVGPRLEIIQASQRLAKTKIFPLEKRLLNFFRLRTIGITNGPQLVPLRAWQYAGIAMQEVDPVAKFHVQINTAKVHLATPCRNALVRSSQVASRERSHYRRRRAPLANFTAERSQRYQRVGEAPGCFPVVTCELDDVVVDEEDVPHLELPSESQRRVAREGDPTPVRKYEEVIVVPLVEGREEVFLQTCPPRRQGRPMHSAGDRHGDSLAAGYGAVASA
mmetsp:Transcript_18094/g.59098  ORF Transcript_18094/g.59098 Transcript_18094/m.59098 type:complete len:227 (+) Transcript_18094:761-1441(+)